MSGLALSDLLILLGLQQEHGTVLSAADLFFLSSGKDLFPATVLAAMAYGLPVVGVAGTGGVEEQICGGLGGVIVPYGDVRC